jgi:hypothetical protein
MVGTREGLAVILQIQSFIESLRVRKRKALSRVLGIVEDLVRGRLLQMDEQVGCA